jgi:hypothetical protein
MLPMVGRLPPLVATLAVAGSLLCAAPACAGEAAVGVELGASPDLVRFDTDTPGTAVARIPISGLLAGELVTAIDVRPASGELLALTSVNRVVTVDLDTGAAHASGAPIDPGALTPGQPAGIDFNPTVDRLRLVDAANDNLRYNPLTFEPVDTDDGTPGVQGDTDLAFIGTDPNVGVDPNVVAAAYTNNDNDGATATTLFGIDSGLDVLVRQGAVDGNAGDVAGGGSPNGGLLTTIGGLGANISDAALDVVRGAAPGSNVAFAAMRGASGPSTLYTVNLATGLAAARGTVGGAALGGFAIMPGGALRTAALSTAASEAAPSAKVTVQRSGDSLSPVSVAYRTADRTAVGGRDYTAVSGTLDYAQGERSKDIVIPLRQDSELEGTQAFALLLGPTAGGAALDTREHVVEIADDERSSIQISIAPDRIKPALLLAPSLPDHLRALRRAGRLRVDFACSEACSVDLTLKSGRTQLGRNLATLAKADVKRATVRITKAGRRALTRAINAKSKRRVALSLTGTAVDKAGNSRRQKTTLRLARR